MIPKSAEKVDLMGVCRDKQRIVRVGWWSGAIVLALLGLFSEGEALAQSGRTPFAPVAGSPLRFEVGMTGWISSGQMTWSHNASAVDATVGNPTSRLQYKDVAVNFTEFNGTLTIRERGFLRAAFGFAEVGGGRLTDADFVSASGATSFNTSTPGAQRISRTFSDVKGDNSWYFTAEGGVRVVNFPGHRGHLDVVGGYRYWYQRHVATGVGQVECTSLTFCDPVGTVSHQRQDVIANSLAWHSLEVGLETEYRLFTWLNVYGKAAFIPVSRFSNEDVHYLRSDLRQDPSFRMTGWGIGANLEAGASVRLLSRLWLDAGYRVWWNRAITGTWENFPASGTSVSVPLNELRTVRQGLTIGLRLMF